MSLWDNGWNGTTFSIIDDIPMAMPMNSTCSFEIPPSPYCGCDMCTNQRKLQRCQEDIQRMYNGGRQGPPPKTIQSGKKSGIAYVDVYEGGSTPKRYYEAGKHFTELKTGFGTSEMVLTDPETKQPVPLVKEKKVRSRNELYRGMFMRKKRTSNLTASQLIA